MISSGLPSLMAAKRERIMDIHRETGISRTTLTAIYYGSGKAISFDVLGKLCKHFSCDVGEILRFEEGQA